MSAPVPPVPAAPFLVWPVARREFYRALSFALLPPLAWGAVIFGWRALLLLIASIAAASFSHSLLKRFTTFGRVLVYPHAVTSAMLLVALSLPTWPAWIVACMALLLPPAFALLGGPGKERAHLAVLFVLALQFLILPLLPNQGLVYNSPYAVPPSPALLARDRLVMGDVRNQAPALLYHWPTSIELQGNDALRMAPPAQTAVQALDVLSEDFVPAGHDPATLPLKPMRDELDTILATGLPGMDMILLGAFSGRTGLVSLAGILAGGLYLAYRYILRPRSVALFLLTYAFFLLFLAFPPTTLAHANLHHVYRFVVTFPTEIASLLATIFLTSDAPFAAVFLLALPGTEPLTPRGRRGFLFAAALAAALLTRFAPAHLPLPACTTALTLLMPAAPFFDRLFARRSWLSRSPA
jgi:hypothetical protein